MTLERVSAERMECLHRIDERTKQESLEGEKRQVMFTLRRTLRMMTTAIEFCPPVAADQVYRHLFVV